MINYRKLVEAKEEWKEALDLTLWEGRYADYFAFTLHKIKSTAAWGAVDGLYDLSWVEIRDIIDHPAVDDTRKKVVNASTLDPLIKRLGRAI